MTRLMMYRMYLLKILCRSHTSGDCNLGSYFGRQTKKKNPGLDTRFLDILVDVKILKYGL